MKKSIIIILIILSLVVLFFIFKGDEQDLGDGYYYLPKYEAKDVGYPNGAIIYKSRRKYSYDDVKISGEVISVNKNKEFIIAIQKVDREYNIKMKTNASDSNSLHYYIIAKKIDSVYGPLNYSEFLKKRKDLKVPEELIFKKE